MVVFVDLESDDEELSPIPYRALNSVRYSQRAPGGRFASGPASGHPSNDNVQDASASSFSAALTCYPVAFSLSSHLDLNDLHSLSLTCHSIHYSLIQFSHQLVSNSLRCSLNDQPLLSDLRAAQIAEAELNQTAQAISLATGSTEPPIISQQQHGWPTTPWSQINPGTSKFGTCSKISACARDLVAECRKCGTIVCRNCATKPPSDRGLKDRYRRLCLKCLKAPLPEHLNSLKKHVDVYDSPPISSASSTRSARSTSGSSNSSTSVEAKDNRCSAAPAFTSNAFLRNPCSCASRGVYLCTPCGHNLRAKDVTYKRVWTWRSRYSTHIGGGLGTGLGAGNQGQKCGRGDRCLETGASGVSWVEIDCSEGLGLEHGQDEFLSSSHTGTPVSDGSSPGPVDNRPGYLQQEVEGIGGVVKKKVKKRVKVGATVWEYDDERKTGRYLEREASGQERSWCGWCGRVCLGERDRQEL